MYCVPWKKYVHLHAGSGRNPFWDQLCCFFKTAENTDVRARISVLAQLDDIAAQHEGHFTVTCDETGEIIQVEGKDCSQRNFICILLISSAVCRIVLYDVNACLAIAEHNFSLPEVLCDVDLSGSCFVEEREIRGLQSVLYRTVENECRKIIESFNIQEEELSRRIICSGARIRHILSGFYEREYPITEKKQLFFSTDITDTLQRYQIMLPGTVGGLHNYTYQQILNLRRKNKKFIYADLVYSGAAVLSLPEKIIIARIIPEEEAGFAKISCVSLAEDSAIETYNAKDGNFTISGDAEQLRYRPDALWGRIQHEFQTGKIDREGKFTEPLELKLENVNRKVVAIDSHDVSEIISFRANVYAGFKCFLENCESICKTMPCLIVESKNFNKNSGKITGNMFAHSEIADFNDFNNYSGETSEDIFETEIYDVSIVQNYFKYFTSAKLIDFDIF